jgi:ABC-2 type transport system permease protein
MSEIDSMQTSVFRMFWLVVRHEFRVLIADRSFLLMCALLAAMIGYAFCNAKSETDVRERAVSAVLESERATAERHIETLRNVNAGLQRPGPFDHPANPATIGGGAAGRYAVVPSGALAPIAVGQADMNPSYYAISYRSKVQFMFDSEIENPWKLLSGHFDLAFVIVFVLPLLIFASSYNLLSSERELGTLKMVMSQPLGLVTFMLSKVFVRAGALLTSTLVLSLLLLFIFRPEVRQASQLSIVGLWVALTCAYGIVWFALALAVNALGRSSATNALILIAAWTVLVLVVPVLLNLGVSLARPAPSRTELATHTRVLEAENLRRYDELFHGDYRYIDDPAALLVKDGRIEMPPRTRAFFLADKDMDAGIDGLLKRFDTELDAQQRLVDRFGVLSPGVLAYEGMASLAGNGSKRYLAFKSQVNDFHEQWRAHFYPRVLNGIAMDENDLRAIPQWTWRELPRAEVHADGWRRILLLSGIAGVLLAFGVHRLQRHVLT